MVLSDKLYTILIKGDAWKTILKGLGVRLRRQNERRHVCPL